jgi:hypothetical protein
MSLPASLSSSARVSEKLPKAICWAHCRKVISWEEGFTLYLHFNYGRIIIWLLIILNLRRKGTGCHRSDVKSPGHLLAVLVLGVLDHPTFLLAILHSECSLSPIWTEGKSTIIYAGVWQHGHEPKVIWLQVPAASVTWFFFFLLCLRLNEMLEINGYAFFHEVQSYLQIINLLLWLINMEKNPAISGAQVTRWQKS